MKITLILIVTFVFGLCQAQNPIFKKYAGIDFRSINEFEEFNEYKSYGGAIIGSDSTRQFGFSHYGFERDHIVIFKTVRTLNKKGVYTLIDAIVINDLDSNQFVMYGQCRIQGKDDAFIVVVHKPTKWENEFFDNIIQAWRANPETNSFEVIDPNVIDCYNEGFGCLH